MNEVKNKKPLGYANKKGEEVKIVFMDGKSIKGKLLGAFTYEIILEVETDGKPAEVSIFKHAVKYVISEPVLQ